MTDTSTKVQPDSILTVLSDRMFKVTYLSALSSVVGACIVIYAQWSNTNWQPLLGWTSLMLLTSLFRIIISRRGLGALALGNNPGKFVDLQTVLVGFVGAGWVSAMFLFDTNVIDQNLCIRLMMILAILSFTVSSMAVFKRVTIIYLASIVVPMLAFFYTHTYLNQWATLFPTFLIYTALIAGISYRTNKQIYAAASDQVQVASLTVRLTQALAVETQLRHELNIRADTDELTSILNRRGLMKQLHLELARCKRYKQSGSILIVDIDFFKKVNDTYGHASGDLVLVRTVEYIKDLLRETDVFGRFGGEEFLIFLPATAEEGTLLVAERIRKFIEQATITLDAASIQITISVGVAICSGNEGVDDLFVHADYALYAAKNHGRNRVEMYKEPVSIS